MSDKEIEQREILFRGMRVDTKEWIEGTGVTDFLNISNFYPENAKGDKRWMWSNYSWIEVIPETVGQLRYTRGDQKYFDGDVYYQAGYGKEIVSELCELQCALLDGNESDIEGVIGNIHEGVDDE